VGFEFPPSVLFDVVDTYGPRYQSALAFNTYLSYHAISLFNTIRSSENLDDLVHLIRTANPYVLRCVLDTDIAHDDIIRAIVGTWNLSPKDQICLTERDLSSDTIKLILARVTIDQPAREILLSRVDLDPTTVLHPSRPPSHQVSEYSSPVRYPEGSLSPALAIPEPGITVAELSQCNFRLCALSLAACLADKPLSLRAWMLFLALVEDDPDVPLTDVIAVANRLAEVEISPTIQRVSA
jgi:hypothetical protein